MRFLVLLFLAPISLHAGPELSDWVKYETVNNLRAFFCDTIRPKKQAFTMLGDSRTDYIQGVEKRDPNAFENKDRDCSPPARQPTVASFWG